MGANFMQQTEFKVAIIIGSIIIMIIAYLFRSTEVVQIDIEEKNVSICQIRVQFDIAEEFDDRKVLSILAVLKMHDFLIGQPVWGPSDTLFYFCEHRLKIGVKQSILDKELMDIISNFTSPSGRLAWTCV